MNSNYKIIEKENDKSLAKQIDNFLSIKTCICTSFLLTVS